MNITINNQVYEVAEGMTILEICSQQKIDVPTFCYERGLTISGSCRICVVEVRGQRRLVAACSTPAVADMVIDTESSRAVAARRQILSLMIANHHQNCPECHRNNDCKLQTYCNRYQVTISPFADGSRKKLTVDQSNPFFIRDHRKCILCGKCVSICSDINGAHAIDFTQRGYMTKVTSSFDVNLQETGCTFCGMCVDVCPVGALVAKSEIGSCNDGIIKKTQTTCSFCGVGCQLQLKTSNQRIIGVQSDRSGSNDGHLCVKGKFGWEYIHSDRRLQHPLIKDRQMGEFVQATWEQAIDCIYENFQRILHDHGGTALAGLCSAKATNEENYLFQKLIRTVFQSNNIDHCARL